MSSVFPLSTNSLSKIFREEQSILVERTFENEKSWRYYFLIAAI